MVSPVIKILSLILMFKFVSCIDDELNFIEHNQTMRIALRRQKPPLEQHINAPLSNYGITLDWLYKPVPPPRTNDTILLRRFLDHELYGEIVIGHPGQTLYVAFDTTWSYTWVLSSQCSAIEEIGCYFHRKYNHQKSSEYKPDGTKFSVHEGPYNLTGFFSYDNISVTHSNVTNFSFIEIVSAPRTLLFNKADGVMGLGLQVDSYVPFFYKLLEQKKIKDPIYSIYINRNHDRSDRGGNILLGFVDKKHFKVDVIDGKKVYDKAVFLPVEGFSYWQFQMDKIVVSKDPKNNDTLCAKGCKAIVDTSSSTIIGPEDEVKLINERIGANRLIFNRYSVDCDRVNSLPKINFVIGGKTFTFSGAKYITKMTFKSIMVCLSSFQPAEMKEEESRWILGSIFMAEAYTIFDVGQKRIGFVRAA